MIDICWLQVIKMPLTSAIQSAMAVRMEREKRHQRRLSKIRRESGASHASQLGEKRGSHASTGSSIICTKRQSVASTGTLEEEVELIAGRFKLECLLSQIRF